MVAKLSVLSAAALLAGGFGLATAAETGMSKGSSAASQSKCYDQATRQIRNKTAMDTPSSKSASGTPKPGELKTGSNQAGNAGTTGSGGPSQRPAAAAGLPDC